MTDDEWSREPRLMSLKSDLNALSVTPSVADTFLTALRNFAVSVAPTDSQEQRLYDDFHAMDDAESALASAGQTSGIPRDLDPHNYINDHISQFARHR